MEDDPLDLGDTGRIERLERQVARLEAELGELRSRTDRRPTAGESHTAEWEPPTRPTETAPWPTPRPEPLPTTAVTERAAPPIDSETLLKWAGVLLVVLAVGFAVSTAISRGWIGPELQLLGALIVGFGLVGLGLRLRDRRRGWTHALCSGGVLALFTTVASELFVDQMSTGIAFASTVVIAIGGIGLARWIDSEWVAVATFAGGTTGWAVIARDDPPVVASTVWIVALVAVTVALATERGWYGLRFVGHLTGMIVLISLLEEIDGTADRVVILAAAGLLTASLFVVPSLGPLTSIWQRLEVQLAVLAAPWAFLVVAAVIDTERDATIGWTAVTIAAGAAAIAVMLRSRLRAQHEVSLLIGASITLSIGVAALLSTTATFLAIAVQGAGLVVLARSFGRDVRLFVNAGVLLAIATAYVTVDMIAAWSDDRAVTDDIGNALIIAAIAVAAWQAGEHFVQRIGAVVTLALVLVWLGSVLVHLPQGQALVSIAWAVIGTAVFVTGAIRQDTQIGLAGLAVLGLTVAKLLTVDLREVDALWRAGLFFLVGVGLLRLGFMLPRLGGDPPDETGPTPPTPVDNG